MPDRFEILNYGGLRARAETPRLDKPAVVRLPSPRRGRGVGDEGAVSDSFTLTPALSRRGRGSAARLRRGQALVEFALVALVLYLLIAFVLDFGRAIYGTQIIQGAADLAA